MNNRDRSPSWGSAISGSSRKLCFIGPVDASPADHKATVGLKGCQGAEVGQEGPIALCHWQFRNDGGWPVLESCVYGVQKC